MKAILLARLFILAIGFGAIATAPAVAQQALKPGLSITPQQRADDDLITYYYRDARPERLVGFLDRLQNTSTDGDAYPSMVGFFAVVFSTHPDWIDRLVPANVNAKMAETVSLALQFAGEPPIPQSVQARLANAGSNPRLIYELPNLPHRLEDVRITLPNHLDMFWGAFFASGDARRYVRPILDFFAKTANRSEPVALDVTRITVAISGGPRDIYGQLKEKYGNAGVEMVYAATAEWALMSNAPRHPAVDSAVAAYIAENPDGYATKSLIALRSAHRQ